MSKKEKNFDDELEKIARKSNFNIRKTEYAFENRLKKLDSEIDNVLNEKIREFDDNKKLTSDYLNIEHDTLVIDRYREKLKRI